MTRTAIRHTLSALATLALVSAFAASPVSAQPQSSSTCTHCGAMGLMQLMPGESKPKAPEGLATKKSAPHSGNLLDKPTFGEKF